MAVFEKSIPRKITLDDTEELSCNIENTQNIHGHTEYVIRVQRGPTPDRSWQVFKRYKDFISLHQVLMTSGLSLPMPPKKIIGNMNREFVAERKVALQKYLNIVLQNRYLSMSLAVKKFLDPEHYSLPFEETALQHVSMVLRGEMNYQVIRPIPELGTRLRKHYYFVSSCSDPTSPMLLSWAEHGPDKFLEEKNLRAVFKALASLQHPFIHPIELAGVNDTGGFVIRRLSPIGSLRDVLMGVTNHSTTNSQPKWQQPFITKYCCKSGAKSIAEEGPGRTGLSNEEISIYGAQILDALIFLQDKGLPCCGHIHSGNVVISGGFAKLLDVENAVLGLPQWNRHFLLRLPKPRQSSPMPHSESETHPPSSKKGCIDIADTYCFGRLLYEMATGKELAEPTLDIVPPLSSSLCSLLEQTLSSESCRQGLPTLHELRLHPFFSRVKRESQGHLKISSSVREALRLARMKAEDRIREDQRMLRHQRRLAKVREILNSSDETKLRRLKQKALHPSTAPAGVAESSGSSGSTYNGSASEAATLNGRSPEDLRSDSPNSISTATSASTVTPSPPPSIPGGANACRGALLGSICNFDRNALKHVSASSVNGGSQ